MDLDLKARIRAELFRCAIGGQFLTYTGFFNRISPGIKMGNFPYQTHFNEIAKEERNFGYPDITFMVRSVNGYPRQIEFRPVVDEKPDAEQLKSLLEGTDKIIALYCPSAANPYRR